MNPDKLKTLTGTTHATLSTPPKSQDGSLWRYMDLAKFIDLLITKELFFTRQLILSNIDPLEGTYTRGTYELFDTIKINIEGNKDKDKKRARDVLKHATAQMVPIMKRIYCICCLHQNRRESDAMWKIYAKDNQGVAIKCSIDNFLNSIDPLYKDKIILRKVVYNDYLSENQRENISMPVFHKDISYEHENEVRAIIWDETIDGKTYEEMINMPLSKGIKIPIDPNICIDEIVLAPDVANWYKELVIKIIRELGLNIKVEMSQYKIPYKI